VSNSPLKAQTSAWDTLYNYINDTLIAKKRFDEAHTLSLKNLQTAELNFGKKHLNYALSGYQLGQIFYFKKEYKNGVSFISDMIENLKTTVYKDSIYYGQTLNLLGITYRRLNENEKAEQTYLTAYNTIVPLKKAYPKEYSACLNNLAVLYLEIGKTDEAIDFTLKAIELALPKSEIYITRLNTLSLLYKRKGRFKEALQYAQDAQLATDKKNAQYPLRLITISSIFAEIGLYEKALTLAKQALEMVEISKGKKSAEYAIYANSMSILNLKIGNNQEALNYGLSAQMAEENNKDKPEYYYYQSQVANCYTLIGDTAKALPMLLESLDFLSKKPGKKSESYLNTLGNIIRLCQKKGDIQQALKLNQDELDLIKTAWSDVDDRYFVSLMRHIQLLNAVEKPDNSTILLKELAQKMNEKVLYNIDVLDELSKEIFINNFIKDYEPLLFSQIKNTENKDKELITKAYEAELAIKGIILGSSQLFRQAAQNAQNALARNVAALASDSVATKGVKQWTNLKENISKAYTRNASQKHIDSLISQLSIVEDKMIRLMPELQHFQRKTTRFEDVKNALKTDDCAIEFVRFKYHNTKNWTDSILYGAMVVLPNKPTPEFVYLCTEMELKTLLNKTKNPQQLYATRGKRNTDESSVLPSKELYNLMIKPLEPYFKGIKTLHYAPSGLLHQVAFAALPATETDLLSDQFQLIALSSTRELVKSSADFKIENCTLYGGIQYGETTVKDPSNTNTPWQYLEGTKKEIDRISTLFKKGNIKFDIKQGLLASEEAFKAKSVIASESVVVVASDSVVVIASDSVAVIASDSVAVIASDSVAKGVSTDILHIATHGFFFKNNPAKASNSAFQTANNPLIRSGLIMANANKVWLGEAPQEGREDGILTAYEISNMDLSKTHLVVLSACETGLGDIQGTEGVYGLQRAFKMAGVEYILMSLWQVPDKQTAELMEQFYSNLLNGATIQAAFSTAQQSMKEKYSPYYWAGFVLMR
jgi:CHAT domain-containing protein